MFAAAAARRARGALVCRVEDLDAPRTVAGAEAALLDDLAWLGVTFDEGPREGGAVGPYRQSERLEMYADALADLTRAGHTYLCDCSRADIARLASAPHEGEEGPRYPGTCRDAAQSRTFKRPPAVRLRVSSAPVTYDDAVQGAVAVDVAAAAGDFVLRRGDGVFSYQLAVTVDDVAMKITEVVRGADLRSSAPRQALIARLLGAEPPRYLHVPLLVGADGARLAKRSAGVTVAGQRASGTDAASLLATLAEAYGQSAPSAFEPHRFPTGDVRVPAHLLSERGAA
jgi:glutamyl-tRNA synthetase